MTKYSAKLANMRSRRHGLETAALAGAYDSLYKAQAFAEAYEARGKTEAATYALGAMQALDAKYTEVSLQEGERVKTQLYNGLQSASIAVTFEYQGSVPLNIHIRRASDIDILVLQGAFITVDSSGIRASSYRFLPGTRSVLEAMMTLRQQCENVLAQRFPAVTVDKSGAKAISLSGGSLQRKVDVVPSHWHDTAAYQISREKHDREIKILDKHERALQTNRPFLHMRRIEDKDARTNGGTKKAIRLLKNIKRDCSREIGLSSYDIAALIWNQNDQALNKPYYLELSLVAEVQSFLQYLIANPIVATSLDVPDASRRILDSSEKFQGLQILAAEVSELARDIARELKPIYNDDYDQIRRSLLEAQVF